MTVIRMRNKEKRRDRRQSSNLVLIFDDNEFDVLDCSLGGLAISNGAYIFIEEQELTAQLCMPVKDQEALEIEVAVKVIRVDKELNQVALQFDKLSNENFRILEKYLTHRTASSRG